MVNATTESRRYGPHPSHFAEIRRPARDTAGAILLLHGGWWRQRLDLHLMDRLADDLVRRGHLVWNVEYRRIDAPGAGGGWPTTLDDVLAAIEMLVDAYQVDARQVVAVGHSAGGHLGLLATVQAGLAGTVALAPITDLTRCAAAGLGEGATPIFMGAEPADDPGGYRMASPVHRLPVGQPQLVVHGTNDDRVPIAHSQDYVRLAGKAGDDAELVEVAGADHMFVLDPGHEYWPGAFGWMERVLTG